GDRKKSGAKCKAKEESLPHRHVSQQSVSQLLTTEIRCHASSRVPQSPVMRESLRMRSVQAPIIPIVAELIGNCPGTISLGQGVVSYGPPQEAMNQLSRFLTESDNHKYKPVHGLPALIEAWSAKLRAENKLLLGPDTRLAITAGGNMAFMNAVL